MINHGGGVWYCDRLVYRQGLRHLFLPQAVFAVFDIYIAKQFLCNPMNSQTHNHHRGPKNCWLSTLKVISITCISLQVSMDAFFLFSFFKSTLSTDSETARKTIPCVSVPNLRWASLPNRLIALPNNKMVDIELSRPDTLAPSLILH